MKDPTPDLAYLLITAHDVAMHPDLSQTLQARLNIEVNWLAAEYANLTRCVPVVIDEDTGVVLRNWSDLDDVIHHAYKAITAAMSVGWLPKDATTPF